MSDLNLTAKLLAGEEVDEIALKLEIGTADMRGESFFSPAHEQTEGLQLLETIEATALGNDEERQNVSSRARALLGRAEEIAQNADERELLVARLKHRMEEDGLPEPTDEELSRIAKLVRVVHGVEVDVHQPKWEPPRAVLEVDPNSLRTADTGPVIGPAPLPPPHKQRDMARRMREKDRDRGRDDTTARADARGAGRTGGARSGRDATSGAGGSASGGSGASHAGASTGAGAGSTGSGAGTGSSPSLPPGGDPPATTSTSTGTGSGGGGGPNTATASVHIHLDHVTWPTPPASSLSVTAPTTQTVPAGSTAPAAVPVPTPTPLPAANVDLQALLQFVEGVQTRNSEQAHRMVEILKAQGEQTVDRVLEAQRAQTEAFQRAAEEQTAEMERLRQAAVAAQARPTTLRGWFLNTGFGQALIAVIVVYSLMGLAWWATKPTDHGTPSTIQRTQNVQGR